MHTQIQDRFHGSEGGHGSCGSDDSDSSSSALVDEEEEEEEEEELSRREERGDAKRQQQCKLTEYLFASRDDYPKTHLLLSAHLQLNSLHQGTKWTTILRALKELGPESRKSVQGDEKAFRRLNVKRSYPEQQWTTSLDRLLARLDCAFASFKEGDYTQSYAKSLSTEETKAFTACLQVWKRSFRGSFRGGQYSCRDDTIERHHYFTALEASFLCRRDRDSRLVICVSGEVKELGNLAVDLVKIDLLKKEDDGWDNLEVCAEESDQAKAALEVILGQTTSFLSITISKHKQGKDKTDCSTNVMTNNIRTGMVEFPPRIVLGRRLHFLRNTLHRDKDDHVFFRSDYLRAISEMESRGELHRCFEQPAKLASLNAMASLIVRRHALDISSLPTHLQESSRTATTCSSCKRIMTSGRFSKPRDTLLSYRQQATLAGFKPSNPSKDEVVESLSARRAYLPPLIEKVSIATDIETAPFCDSLLSNGTRHRVTTQIGGSNLLPLKDSGSTDWQFCAFCAASHMNLIATKYCQCFICVDSCLIERVSLRHRRAHLGGISLPISDLSTNGPFSTLTDLREKIKKALIQT